jgi:hypothetical protein
MARNYNVMTMTGTIGSTLEEKKKFIYGIQQLDILSPFL